MGEEPKTGGETVTQYLNPALLEIIFRGAERVGEVGGILPAAAVYKGDRRTGYLFSTWDVTQSKGFSDQPLVLLVGLDLEGRITGARVVHHIEPIAILGLYDGEFHRFTDRGPRDAALRSPVPQRRSEAPWVVRPQSDRRTQ